jgi:lipopolysaccharide transport system permease protein
MANEFSTETPSSPASNGADDSAVGPIVQRSGGGLDVGREIWRRRELVALLAVRTLKIRYKNAALGFVWSLLGPLFLIVIYSVFLGILRVAIDLHVLIVGIIAWHYLATCANDSLHAVMGNANLVRKTAFPRLILPLSMVTANTVNFLLSGLVLAVFLLLRGVPFGWGLAWLPLILLTHGAFCFGLSCFISALNVFSGMPNIC